VRFIGLSRVVSRFGPDRHPGRAARDDARPHQSFLIRVRVVVVAVAVSSVVSSPFASDELLVIELLLPEVEVEVVVEVEVEVVLLFVVLLVLSFE
jgi:hypothetical protein